MRSASRPWIKTENGQRSVSYHETKNCLHRRQLSAEGRSSIARRVAQTQGPLLQTAAAIRFVSAEPLLGPLDLEVIESLCKDWCVGATIGTYLDWVIVGGESGPHARPFKLEWARNLRDQCRGSGVPFFAKQLGSNPLDCDVPGAADPKEHMRYHTDHRSGADPAEWPDDLRVQEFPR